jgi:hypothetical protein
MLTRVEYWHAGWLICHYDDVDAMLAATPYDMSGPYTTEAEAKRVLAEITDRASNENATARKQAYDPSRDPTPATAKTDNDEADPSEVV